MNKILLIIKREYFSRVKKRSFIVMTILGPILMAAMFIVPIYIATQEGDTKKVGVVDETGMFTGRFPNTENLIFTNLSGGIGNAKKMLTDSSFHAILYIPATDVQVPSSAYLYSAKQPSLNVTSYIKSQMSMEVEKYKLEASGVDPEIILSAKTNINLSTFLIDKSGKEEKSFTEVSMIVGWIGGFMIYIFIFMYGAQVMRGVIEEKTSRIVEIIISSVKPFQLMMGKIVGIAMVGLTQFILWILFTGAIVLTFTAIYAGQITPENTKEILMSEQSRIVPDEAYDGFTNIEATQMNIAMEAIQSINFGLILSFFIFFFIGGYLLYASLFASIGSAVDNEVDTQQFMLPITIPLILSIVMIPYIVNNPEGPLVFWFSIIPLTSPIAMMARIPFGVPYFDLALSVVLLIAGFIGTTWLAGKIYRTGILMYGKKVTYRELWKWIRY
jgi:ABC-2 type transport system permease protein